MMVDIRVRVADAGQSCRSCQIGRWRILLILLRSFHYPKIEEAQQVFPASCPKFVIKNGSSLLILWPA